MNIAALAIASLVLSALSLFTPAAEPTFGGFDDPFISIQLATDPDNGECLTTDGTDNVWSSSCGGGSSFDYLFPSNATSTALNFTGGLQVDGWDIGTTTAIVCKQASVCQYTTIGAAISAGHRDIFVKDGTYSEQITISNTKTKLRAQSLNTIIQCNGATQSPCIDAADESVVDGFTLNETNASLVGVAWDASNNSLTIFRNNRVNNFATSTRFSDTGNATFYNRVENNTFFETKTCYEFSGTQANSNWLTKNRCRPMAVDGGYGLYVVDARGIYHQGDIEGTTTARTNIAAYFDASSRDNTIDGSWLEAMGTGLSIASGANNIAVFGSTITSHGTDISDSGTNTRLVAVNRTGTKLFNVGHATSTSFAITGITSSLLKTDASGNVLAAVAGTDYSTFGYLFPSNATSTLLDFNAGLTSASTTLTGPFVFANATGTNATTTSLAVLNLTAASCDVKALTTGVIYCGTDSTGSATFPFDAQSYGVSTSTVVNFAAGFMASGSSTVQELKIGNATTTNATTTNLHITSLTSALASVNANGLVGEYPGSSCGANTLVTAVNALGGLTCNNINNAYWSGTDLSVANGGTGLSTFGGTNTILYTTAADTLSSEAAFTYNPTTDVLTGVNSIFTDSTTTNATTTAFAVTNLTASRAVFTNAISGLTTTGTVGALEAAVGSQNILLETEIDACSELAALLDAETGSCNGSAGPVFPNSPTFSGTVTLASLLATASSTIVGTLNIASTTGGVVYDTSLPGYLTKTFSYATSSQGVGTTTFSLGVAPQALTIKNVQCDFSSFLRVLVYDGTNRANDFIASSTIGTVTYTTNNSFVAGEAMRIDIGTTTAPTGRVYGSCTFKYIFD